MTDLLLTLHPWIKAVHIIAVISWMAGLLYLPRLFVHHVEQSVNNPSIHPVFSMMEGKLYKLIMTPAMIVTWIMGLLMAVTPSVLVFTDVWVWVKFISVLLMSGFHGWLGKCVQRLETGENDISGKTFRLLNEVPTVLMIIIVICVVIRPF